MSTFSGQNYTSYAGAAAANTTAILGGGTDWPGRRVRDVSNKIWLLDAQNTALTTLLRNIRKKHVTDPKFEWYEDAFIDQYADPTAEDATLGDGIIAMNNGTLFRKGDVWLNNDTGELMFVDLVAGNNVTFVRGVGGTTAAAVNTDDLFFYIGNAMAEGSLARDKLTTQTTAKYGHTQLFKEAFEVSNTADTTKLWGGPQRQYLRQKGGIQHTRDIEKAFWLGKVGQVLPTEATNYHTAGQGGLSYLTDGVFAKITSNVATDTSGYTNADFEADLEAYMRYGPDTKFLFCSPRACTTIDKWGRDAIQTVPSDSTFGIKITRYQSSHGNINIIKNKLFYDWTNTSAASSYDMGQCAVLLDLEQLTYCYKRDTRLEMGIQENDRDSVEDQYLTEAGLMMKLEKHHSVFYNFTPA